jgi:hypothetical protein
LEIEPEGDECCGSRDTGELNEGEWNKTSGRKGCEPSTQRLNFTVRYFLLIRA